MNLKHLALIGIGMLCTMALSAQDSRSIFDVKTPSRVSVHDPSVVIGYEKNGVVTGENSDGAKELYCIFGSHRAWAKSYDLQNWQNFKNNISTNYKNIFATDAKWAAKGGKQGGSSYDVTGNLWAPDVIWNKDMRKWCMYMSVNGDNWYSSIVLLTADNLTGDWTRVGPVVYSGFTSEAQARETDFYDVYTGAAFPSRYNENRNGTHTYGLNAIDPCVFYDQEGNLWMTYGSWFGGLYMLRLDKKTGLRDYTYTYETKGGTATTATSDIYQGIKIAGGNNCSGEASYIQYINDRYYLFVTYGGLTAAGGYNMRVFSSKDVMGPYKDLYGHPAIWSNTNTSAGDTKGNVGSRLMSYYQWGHMAYGYVAQGHNSAIVDDDGRVYVVYHTRFTNGGEGHEVRVHQMFTTKNGGLVALPFEYRGEKLADQPYTNDQIVGTYKVINHQGTDYAKLQCRTEQTIELNADGTVSGDFKGTWKQDGERPYITLTTGNQVREGVLVEQLMEGLNCTTMCFAVISNNDIPLWGYKDVGDKMSEDIKERLPLSAHSVLARYNTGYEFNNMPANSSITDETGLSLGFFVSGLGSDWDEIGKSTDDKFTMFLSVLRYNGADFYEASATVDPLSPVRTDLWKAYLNGGYYVTISYNPDGTIAYYRDGVKLFTYGANLSPNYGTGVSPKDIVKAVVNYYRNNQFDFTRSVYKVAVGYSVKYDVDGITDVTPDAIEGDGKAYNLMGMPVGDDYRGIIIINGKKVLRR